MFKPACKRSNTCCPASVNPSTVDALPRSNAVFAMPFLAIISAVFSVMSCPALANIPRIPGIMCNETVSSAACGIAAKVA